MKLKQFIGKSVRGYMNFDIKFRDSVTFLIGINGSGKTTVLKLLSGLLTPSYFDLSQIEFSEISLTCERLSDSCQIIISCKKEGDNLILKYDDSCIENPIENTIPFINQPINKRRYDREMIDIERLNRSLMDFEEKPVVHKIREIKTPLFLGLNRRVKEINEFTPFEREPIFGRRTQYLDILFDSVDSALNDIQDMVFEKIRLNAKRQSVYSDSFRNKVVQNSFNFYQGSPKLSMKNEVYEHELKQLPDRKERLTKAIDELGIKDLPQLDSFFSEMKTTLEILSKTPSTEDGQLSNIYYEYLLKWMINSSQLEKIDHIISYGNQYADNIIKMKEPIIRFTDAVNLFFKEGHKEILIGDQGEIKIKLVENGKTKFNSIFELSSGEKQLLIMFAHLAFYPTVRRCAIFIIDEPELSLHISWQEIFVDALLEANPEMQFIMATHAPAILAKNERKEWCEDLTK